MIASGLLAAAVLVAQFGGRRDRSATRRPSHDQLVLASLHYGRRASGNLGGIEADGRIDRHNQINQLSNSWLSNGRWGRVRTRLLSIYWTLRERTELSH